MPAMNMIKTAMALVAAGAFALTACSSSEPDRGAEDVAPDSAPARGGVPTGDLESFSFLNVNTQQGVQSAGKQWGTAEVPVALGFIGAVQGCAPGFVYWSGTEYDVIPLDDRVAAMVSDLQATSGEAVAFGFGGENGGTIEDACPSVDDLTELYGGIAKDFPDVKTWLFDLEGAGEDVTKQKTRMAAINNVLGDNPNLEIWLVLPVTAQGLDGTGEQLVDAAKQAGVPFKVDIMCQGFTPVPANMETACESALEGTASYLESELGISATQAYGMLGATLQIGKQPNADPAVTTDDARNLQRFATEKGLAGVIPWSLNQDVAPNGQAVTQQFPWAWNYNTGQTSDFEFAKIANNQDPS